MNSLQKNKQLYYTLPINAHCHIGALGKEINQIDYTRKLAEIRADEKKLIHKITGIAPHHCLFLNQVHGDAILIIESKPEEDSIYQEDADAMITNIPDLCLIIRTADCVPICAYDAKKNIIAAIHSGWKGTKLTITRKTIQKMKALYGSKNDDIHIAILPSIGPESYEVKIDVAQFFPGYCADKDKKIYLNLWNHIKESLLEEGIPAHNIFNSNLCTVQHNIDFFSHRKGDPGRNLNFIYLK